MLDFNFYSPTKVFFGIDKEKEVGNILLSYDIKKILLVYGKTSIIKSGLYDRVITSLKENGIEYLELSGIEANPKIDKVRLGVKLIKNNPVDLILAVGGGSVIDTAKAIACGYYIDDDPWKLSIHEITPTKALKIGTILTISAAGSELSNSCVISNPTLKIKNGFNSDIIRPLFSILNPKLTFTVSPFQTACGIVDIMMHTLERFLVDTYDNYFAEEIALGLLRSVIKAGRIVMKDPCNYDARATLMIASSFSHNGLTGLGSKFYFTVHKLEHEVSGTFDHIAHAAGLSILYPAWAKVVYHDLLYKFAKFARDVMNVKGEDDEKVAYEGIIELEKFFKELNMPTSFKELGVTSSSFEGMADRLTKGNNVKVVGFTPLDKSLILEIFDKAK